uniref:(northern house mosquito) hypothetical protein n=1 Tax=Culex pipiens TaxID=7175 RepID=A0A8D8HUM5_CULPI
MLHGQRRRRRRRWRRRCCRWPWPQSAAKPRSTRSGCPCSASSTVPGGIGSERAASPQRKPNTATRIDLLEPPPPPTPKPACTTDQHSLAAAPSASTTTGPGDHQPGH